MLKGFAAYSLPGNTEITAVEGSFGPFDLDNPRTAEVFVLNAWNDSPQALTGKLISDIKTIESRFSQISLTTLQTEFVGTGPDEWMAMVETARQQMELGVFQKVVLSRSEMVSFNGLLWPAFSRAVEQNPDAFVYCIHHPVYGCWMGATPELLLKGSNGSYETVALAGTLTPEQPTWSAKEEKENSVTSDFVGMMIEQCGGKNLQTSSRKEIHSGHLRHLMVKRRFDLDTEKEGLLLKSLHPTPAVGGEPRNSALDFIAAQEKHRRELYTGWIGLMAPQRLDVFVNLRCAKLFKNEAILYAGAGLNADSNWQQEWKETAEKMAVIGKCLNG